MTRQDLRNIRALALAYRCLQVRAAVRSGTHEELRRAVDAYRCAREAFAACTSVTVEDLEATAAALERLAGRRGREVVPA